MDYYCFEHVRGGESTIPYSSIIVLSDERKPIAQIDIYADKTICSEGEALLCNEVNDYMSFINGNKQPPEHLIQKDIIIIHNADDLARKE